MASIVLTAATLGGTTAITPTDQSGAITLTLPSTGGTLQTSGAGFTTNGVAYATSTSALATGSNLKFNGTYLGVGSGTTGLGTVEIQTTSTTAALWVQTGGTTSSYTVADFRTGSNAPALTIFGNATGAFYKTVAVGGATPSTSGSGITFPATQDASSNANTLDDYEEGTWTPTDYSGAGLTFTGIAAAYTKIGRQVFVNGTVTFPSTASTAAANLGSLPFPYGSGTDYTQQGSPIRNNASLSIQPFGLNAGVSNFVFLIIGQYTNYASNLQMSGSTVGFSFNYYTA